uniref:Uncharacterized protein n=1 Tax=Picea glauca TaxID=3330 RepID=A0A117NHX6_PICGL|nr:hypothetical protein ABT39_MTgene4420 [Picea glauca]QHR86245.1 hypothetical protein Q903MT_gene244 [Picea sitchensis]
MLFARVFAILASKTSQSHAHAHAIRTCFGASPLLVKPATTRFPVRSSIIKRVSSSCYSQWWAFCLNYLTRFDVVLPRHTAVLGNLNIPDGIVKDLQKSSYPP